MNRQPYIAIEGPIGVGKTTLARLLGETLPAKILLEVFEQNPFLSDFYTDRTRYAFQTQIFFLLSRYHQQNRVIADTIQRKALASDYLFDKDWLFAHLNLQGDELAMYERVHAILGERIPAPDLVVYLRASTDSLMQRIAFRDRPYERQMDRDYIHALRKAYENFFDNYTTCPLLTVDTEHLDFVRDSTARSAIVGQVKSALQSSAYQPRLLEVEWSEAQQAGSEPVERLGEWQRALQSAGSGHDVYREYLGLVARLGASGQIIGQAWQELTARRPAADERQEPRDGSAASPLASSLADELAHTLDQLLRLANAAGVDMETAYLRHMGAR